MTLVTRDGEKISTSSAALGQQSRGWDLGTGGISVQLGYSAAEKRDAYGRWTRFGGLGQAAKTISHSPEGFSVSLNTGGEPASGYMVAQMDHTHTFPAGIMADREKLARAIDQMLMKEKGVLSGPGAYLGGWVHDGKLWLEPSDNVASHDEAVRLGQARNQIAIWDVAGGQEIQTGGSGGGAITEHANAQGAGQSPGELPGSAGRRADGNRPRAGQPASAGPARQLDLSLESTGISDQIWAAWLSNG